MNYVIKQVNGKWIVYTTGRVYNKWKFDDRISAKRYLEQCKGEKA